jgi:hypothetical protein
MKLTIHLHLVPRSRICGAISTLSQYIFMVWCLVAQGQLYLLPLPNIINAMYTQYLTKVSVLSIQNTVDLQADHSFHPLPS